MDIPRLVVKELVDNALDACEIRRIGRLDEHGIFVEDEGGGIPGNNEDIVRMFSVRRAWRRANMSGNPLGERSATGLGGSPAQFFRTGGLLRVSTRGRTLDLRPESTTGDTTIVASQAFARHGTRIELSLPELRLTGALECGQRVLALAAVGRALQGIVLCVLV